MKILIISHEYPPIGGGGANACMHLSQEFAKRGHDVTVISVWYVGLPEIEGCSGLHIIRVHSKRKQKEQCGFTEMADYLCKAWSVAKQLEEEKNFDVCMVFFGIPSGPIGYMLKKRYKLPYVIRFGGGDIPGFQDRFASIYKIIGPFLKIIWNNAGALTANSEGLKNLAQEFHRKRQIDIIHNGVDTDKFYPPDNKVNVSEKGEIKILFVSRLIERKGLQFVIPKLKYIQEKSKKSLRLIIVGDGPYRDNLEKMTLESKCNEIVSFEGHKDKSELLLYYQQADVFILPSKKEGMPNVVLEAMACGLPIVMTPCEGSKELINDNGIISPIDEFADNLTRLCVDENLRQKMGENSLRRVKEHFQWESIAQRYIELFSRELHK